MAAFVIEFGQWIADNTSLTYGTDLYCRGLPDKTGTVLALLENEPIETDIPRLYGIGIECRGVGENAETKIQEVFDWLQDRAGATTEPMNNFNLTSWSVNTLKLSNSRPTWEGVNDNDEPIWFFEFEIIYRAR